MPTAYTPSRLPWFKLISAPAIPNAGDANRPATLADVVHRTVVGTVSNAEEANRAATYPCLIADPLEALLGHAVTENGLRGGMVEECVAQLIIIAERIGQLM